MPRRAQLALIAEASSPVVIAHRLPERQAVAITKGDLVSAISASCALRGIRQPVLREGKRLKDGGIACVLPSEACRAMGADFVIGSDVWEVSSLLRGVGIDPHHPRAGRTYPARYHAAVRNTNVLIHPSVPLTGYVPGPVALERMILAGENATRLALLRLTAHAA